MFLTILLSHLETEQTQCFNIHALPALLQSRVLLVTRWVVPALKEYTDAVPDLEAVAKLRELWIIPIFFVVTTVVSMIVAYFLSVVLRLKPSQRYGS